MKNMHRFLILLCMLVVTGCSGSRFSGFGSSQVQCVPYARERSGIEIYGDAYSWWDRAAPRYARGHKPRPGAVLVLARTKQMPHGHVAVVQRIVNSREIEVAHTNWGSDAKSRRKVYEAMTVVDVSPRNDWSSVRFWYYDTGSFGFPYAARGFIYN